MPFSANSLFAFSFFAKTHATQHIGRLGGHCRSRLSLLDCPLAAQFEPEETAVERRRFVDVSHFKRDVVEPITRGSNLPLHASRRRAALAED